MPEVPEATTPPSAASEGRAATSTPPQVAESQPVDEVGEPILEPAAPEPPAPIRPRRGPARRSAGSAGAAPGTPSEHELLHSDVEPSPDPVLDIVPNDDIVPARPAAKKAAAKKQAAAPKSPERSPEPRAVPARSKKAAPPKKAAKAAKKAARLPNWVQATDGTCPPTHPVKAKLASQLFHLPGMFAYTRTRADRCYLDADKAVADGLTAAKR